MYAIQSVDNQNSEAKTSQSAIEEQLPPDLDNSTSANDVEEGTSNTID